MNKMDGTMRKIKKNQAHAINRLTLQDRNNVDSDKDDQP